MDVYVDTVKHTIQIVQSLDETLDMMTNLTSTLDAYAKRPVMERDRIMVEIKAKDTGGMDISVGYCE